MDVGEHLYQKTKKYYHGVFQGPVDLAKLVKREKNRVKFQKAVKQKILLSKLLCKARSEERV